ncbi:hypothetical protein RclHR1_20870001 [Rhizophagus clarus]|uniref:Uncharacterized protein n=1 Tax=Rhizophagus clarus TaxID=94130 RepID=A0A2Z6QSA3_9GLOM|nr:hypothetical protein RclHR1_20870001 [Rhizophagus clarus]GET00301.1 hypothetical protein GLOIN_2v1849309 [Rhizophagus clarus]
MLNQAVEKYIKKKEHQRMKPITTDCENLLRKENEELCISKHVLEKKIEELLDLQEQYKYREVAITRSLEESGGKVTQLSDLVAFFKSIIPDTKKAIASAEKSIDILENKCQNLEDIISAKDRKIIAFVDQILSKMEYSDVTIEPEIYSNTHERKLWAKRRSESEHDLETWKKYTFQPVHSHSYRTKSTTGLLELRLPDEKHDRTFENKGYRTKNTTGFLKLRASG